MTDSQPEAPGKHAAPDDDPTSDPPPVAGEGGEHAAGVAPEEGDEEPAIGRDSDEESHSTRQPGADPEDEEEIEEERKERLDPENRPDNVEVDNTDREFDPEKGMFTDSEGYDEAEAQFPAIGDQGA
jgi:hypothetical protein